MYVYKLTVNKMHPRAWLGFTVRDICGRVVRLGRWACLSADFSSFSYVRATAVPGLPRYQYVVLRKGYKYLLASAGYTSRH